MSHKLEIRLEGVFTTVEVFAEGQRITLREVDEHVYTRTYDEFDVQGKLDVLFNLYGWANRNWSARVLIDGNAVLDEKGTFDNNGYVQIRRSITL